MYTVLRLEGEGVLDVVVDCDDHGRMNLKKRDATSQMRADVRRVQPLARATGRHSLICFRVGACQLHSSFRLVLLPFDHGRSKRTSLVSKSLKSDSDEASDNQ